MWLQGELIFNYLCRVSAVNNSQLVFQSESNPLISTFEPFLALPSPYPILHVGRGDTYRNLLSLAPLFKNKYSHIT